MKALSMILLGTGFFMAMGAAESESIRYMTSLGLGGVFLMFCGVSLYNFNRLNDGAENEPE